MASSTIKKTPRSLSLGLIFLGFVVILLAWMAPANFKSLNPALLRKAGQGTPSTAAFGLTLIDAEKPGPAKLVLRAAQALRDPQAPKLATALDGFLARQPTPSGCSPF